MVAYEWLVEGVWWHHMDGWFREAGGSIWVVG